MNSRLKIWLVITQMDLGGTERQVELLARGLVNAGHSVCVVTLFGRGAIAERLEAAGIPIWCAGLSRSPRQALSTLVRLYVLARRLRLHRPDVLHAFLFEAYVLMPPIARALGVPVIVAGRRALGFYKAGRRAARAAEHLTRGASHVLIANSQAVADDVIQGEGVSTDRVLVIPNALGEAEHRAAAVTVRESPVVLCVANFHDYKGHDDLLVASGHLEAGGVPHTLQLVGSGTRRSHLEALAEQTGASVAFLGRRTDVPSLLGQADVFVLPSHSEGMSNALMEAMAAGLACVATDVGGNAEVLGGTGVLCRPRDPVDLARALRQVLRDDAGRHKLGLLAQDRAQQEFSVDLMVQRHVEVYKELLQRREAAGRVRH